MPLIIRKNWLVLMVPLGMLVIATAAVFYPQHRVLQEHSVRISEKEEVLERELAQAARLPELIEEVEEMRRQYHNLDRRLPNQQELGEFLREITMNLPSDELLSDRIEPGNPKREELFQTLPIRMQLQGRYLSLVDFLRHIERMERLARVDTLAMEAQPDCDELKIDMRLNIYFLGD